MLLRRAHLRVSAGQRDASIPAAPQADERRRVDDGGRVRHPQRARPPHFFISPECRACPSVFAGRRLGQCFLLLSLVLVGSRICATRFLPWRTSCGACRRDRHPPDAEGRRHVPPLLYVKFRVGRRRLTSSIGNTTRPTVVARRKRVVARPRSPRSGCVVTLSSSTPLPPLLPPQTNSLSTPLSVGTTDQGKTQQLTRRRRPHVSAPLPTSRHLPPLYSR